MTDKELQEILHNEAERRIPLLSGENWHIRNIQQERLAFRRGGDCAVELMRKENEKLVEALEFYANREFYVDKRLNISIPNNKKMTSSIDDDFGRKARQALKEYRGEK